MLCYVVSLPDHVTWWTAVSLRSTDEQSPSVQPPVRHSSVSPLTATHYKHTHTHVTTYNSRECLIATNTRK